MYPAVLHTLNVSLCLSYPAVLNSLIVKLCPLIFGSITYSELDFVVLGMGFYYII